MRRLMEYKIISGRVTEIRRVMMPFRDRGEKVRRGMKVKGNTSLRKIQANEREAVKNLARILNANFGAGDLWITLTYPAASLPENKQAAQDYIERVFMRPCRRLYKKAAGQALRYVLSTSDVSSDSGLPARLHHHIVMDAMAYEIITKLWPKEDVTYRRLDGRGDYTGIARYIVKNAGKTDGKKRWSTSKNLDKPIYTEPVPVRAADRIRIPGNVSLRERQEGADAETGMFSAYVRYVKPLKPPRSRGKDG